MKALKWGCGGCLVVVFLAVLVGASGLGIAWMQARSSEPEPFQWASAGAGGPEEALAGAAVDPVELPDAAPGEPEAPTPGPAHPVEGSTLVLKIRDVAVEVVPVAAGEALTVQGEFDPDEYSVVHTEDTTESGAPQLTVDIGAEGSGLLRALRSLFRPTPEFRVEIPVDAYDRLEVNGGSGAGSFDLTGLDLSEAGIYFERGAAQVAWDEPSPRPYRSFQMNSIQGAGIVQGLGNASPSETTIRATMGAAVLDATGPWRTDGSIDFGVTMGGGELLLPNDVEVTGADVSPPRDVDPEIPPIRLDLTVTGGDNVDVRRR